ncbi:MAG: DUF3703 domain-containing protein [Alteromonas sp.]|jgi:hypothetical protein|uniref:DUF3703 domain-containing protein n=1 Tax=Alteromonas sp. TaxID=232 RepID=UPI0032D910E5
MLSQFSKNIADSVQAEIAMAAKKEANGDVAASFRHLETAHVLGQESTWWHVKAYILMFGWAFRQKDVKECLGQVFRIIGAATKTAIGLVPAGNTGGSNISPFKTLPIKAEIQHAILKAKGNG